MRVLLVKLSSMGDVIHTLPALTDAYNAIPGIKFTWVIEQGFKDIAYWHPAIDKVIPTALRTRKFKQICSTIKAIRAESYDLVIDAQGLIKSAIVAKIARSKSTVGYDRKSIREVPASFLYKRGVSVSRELHAVPRIRQLFAKALGYELKDTDVSYGVHWTNVIQNVQHLKPYIVFLHGTTWDSKHWPDEYWVELANIVARHGLTVQVTWATEQQMARAQMLANCCPNVIMLPHLTIDQAATVLFNSSGVVAVDTGFAHLSAALQKPMVAIYGATDVLKAGTVGKNNINLSSKFECSPCSKRTCTYVGASNITPACYKELSPQLVWQNLAALIANVH